RLKKQQSRRMNSRLHKQSLPPQTQETTIPANEFAATQAKPASADSRKSGKKVRFNIIHDYVFSSQVCLLE
ncbi:hypothetical protein QUB74_23625, partial [Microcoleus sp. A2-C2]|uniref:hypothetical protein n=1 Tax=unclassified Microcoleus TaxID=2642155 RepID=UPI002FD66452